jgi:transposase
LGIPPDDPPAAENAPSYEELVLLVARLEQRVEGLVSLNQALVARIADLNVRVGKNSRNSSKPPSSDGLSKPPAPNRAERRAQGRRPGKQPGEKGTHLAQVKDPDDVVMHCPETCASCGAGLARADVVDVEIRQVFDLPVIRPFVTEHRLERRRCACGALAKATAPKEATAAACYGVGVRSVATYLAVYQHLPYDRMARLFADVLGTEISVGTLAQMVKEAGGALGGFTTTVAELLKEAPVVHFDETGARVSGRLHWVHVASNALLTLLECHGRRGKVAMGEMGVIDAMGGIAVHDGFSAYRSYGVSHALCNAHHLRELEAIATEQRWADEMIALLMAANKVVQEAKLAGRTALDAPTLDRIEARYQALLIRGSIANPRPRSFARSGMNKTATNLIYRLRRDSDQVLRFATDFRAPFDNNQAERDIRMVKLQQKISGTWRTLAGAQGYCAIRSYISTLKKQDQNILLGLRDLFEGHAWLPAGT